VKFFTPDRQETGMTPTIKRYADGRLWWRVAGERGWHGGTRPDYSEVPELLLATIRHDTSITDAE
jgi:hypothetical protein